MKTSSTTDSSETRPITGYWREDTLALVAGGVILLLATLAWLVLPWQAVMAQWEAARVQDSVLADWRPVLEDSGLHSWLSALVFAPVRWQLNPFTALTGPVVLSFMGLTLALGSGFMWLMGRAGKSRLAFFRAFLLLSLLALVAMVLGQQHEFRSYGLGYALWAIVLGLFITNLVGLPALIKPALQPECYVKTGLILLGAEVLFSKIMVIGLPGLFVAWVVTPVVLVLTYWFGQRVLRMESRSLNMTISADMSVCGVSAAIAAASACGARKEELTTAIGLSMLFTSVMMIVLPAFIRAMGMPEVLGGAWIGGTIDATGAVVAAGAVLGETAMNVAATIKMIQNILIGVMAFAIAVYWSARVERDQGRKVGASAVWQRFPRFILGFVAASLFFSWIFASLDDVIAQVLLEEGLLLFTSQVRDWLFCLAFASIGLACNFRELRQQFTGGKPLLLYLCGQSLNLCLTLLMAWLMFYQVFPEWTHAL